MQSTTTKECLKENNGGFIIELSMLFRKTKPSWIKTFEDLSKFLYDEVMNKSHSFDRVDVITDRYFTDSLKEGTRRDRGSAKGLIFPFDNNTVIPSNFQSKFLSNADNKTKLNTFLLNKFLEYHEGKQSVLVITSGNTIKSNCNEIFSEKVFHLTAR